MAPVNDDMAQLRALIEQRAHEHGFDRIGFARVTPIDREAEALRRWLAEGHHGTMDWMERTAEVRMAADSGGMLPHARTVIALAASVYRSEGRIGPSPGVVARFARGRDYHNAIGKRSKKLAAELRALGHEARATTDTIPILERAWAQRAGVGFIGKNAMLIIPGFGSHVILSTIVTTAELPADEPMQEKCGSCTLCLDACPTGAIVEDRVVDARRCISYLTIEHEGPIDPELRRGVGDWFLGCDVCQDVCPFNRTAPKPSVYATELAPHPRWEEHDAASVLRMTEAEFDPYSIGSIVRRAGREGASRNAAYVLGNSHDKRYLPVLREAEAEDPSETVRDAARWAISEIEGRDPSDEG